MARKDFPAGRCGFGSFLEDALTLRAASSTSTAFFGIRRASDLAALNATKVCVDSATGTVDTKVRRQKNGLFLRGGACPLRLPSGWLRLRKRLAVFRNHARRSSGTEARAPLFVGLARAHFGLPMAASGMSASWKQVMEGRNLSSRIGGARLYLMNGMSRQATQELGRWKTPTVMESVYNKARSGEVVPEMRSATNRACAFFFFKRS